MREYPFSEFYYISLYIPGGKKKTFVNLQMTIVFVKTLAHRGKSNELLSIEGNVLKMKH